MKLLSCILLVTLSSLQGSGGQSNPDPNVIFPLVTTPLGQLRGVSALSRAGKLDYEYKGIPYAKFVGRFQPALHVEPWTGLLDAREYGAICAQLDPMMGAVVGQEDCLTLNVFFPHYDRCQNESENGDLPVVVHIHGGGFVSGKSSQYGPGFILDECVVYVTTTYRVGALGFLTTENDVIPGNLGLKDQVLALKWIQGNIGYFRGDPTVVNINGESAGAFSVSHHITSPMSAGLFTTVSASSGSVMCPWGIQEHPIKYARQLAQTIGCTATETSAELKSCLLGADLQSIILNQNGAGDVVPVGPTLEPTTTVDPFQTVNPAILLRNGEFSRVPLIIGFAQDEGIQISAGPILADPEMTSRVNNSWMEWAPLTFAYNNLDLTQEEMDRVSREIRQFYFGDKDIGLGTRQELVNLFSDRFFVQGTLENIALHSMYAPVYAYVTSYKGGFTFATQCGYEIPVITHAEDSQYLFSGTTNGVVEEGKEQYEFSRKMVQHLVNFAKTG